MMFNHSDKYFVRGHVYITKMTFIKITLALALFIVVVNAQRPSFAGQKPIGYPDMESDLLSNRFGEDEDLPIEAKGDRGLIDRLNKLPVENQPFWFLNWKQYEDFRRQPQNWPQRENSFIGTK
ncbi:unnamed protein product [Arctia plantaginis]|uniref:Uncharacterized protein n=1 Tax=Arctia plantaginis TaxID=874455 RepID=A0A8S1B1K7_ARCPL|nr:unnamed protein product [Arctia plantaginis]